MILDDSNEEFFAYQQASFESPDLRPILLPMSGFEKSSTLEGMINLQAVNAAFPDSNAFGQYLHPAYPTELANQHMMATQDESAQQGLYAENDFDYSVDFVDQREMVPMYAAEPPMIPSMLETHDHARKRKGSPTPDYIEPQPRKRAAVAHLQLQDINGDFHDLSSQASPFSSVVPTPGNSISYQGGQEVQSPHFRHHYSVSNASQVSLPAPSPHTPCFSPSFTTVKTEHSPRVPMTPVPRPASTSSTYSSNPKLVRTSTIPQQGSPNLSNPATSGMHAQPFNPYAMYPQHKANLRMSGDLDAVALDWSAEEHEARRKLIVFTRSQSGSTIEAEFKTVAPQDWQRSEVAINCIWWEERKEAYITSVDTIALLEQLVAVRFTVEEKNRIRRNLEGFRPLTVSKARPDSEEFFKVIMGFANPKPRNIEKDVKVFPWRVLSQALKKIIGKYSASYSSTASSITTPVTNGFVPSEQIVRFQYMPSPNPEMMATSMQSSTVPVMCYDAHVPMERVSMPMTTAMPALSVQVPTMGPQYNMAVYGYNYEAMQHNAHAAHAAHSARMMSQPGSAPIQHTQPAWTFNNFEQQHPGPFSAPPGNYPRGHIETADLVTPAYFVQHG